MFDNNLPLRYEISSWYQLTECKSNNSRDLYIKVSKFALNDTTIGGTRITIRHKVYGILFSYMIDAVGSLVTIDESTKKSYQISNDSILKELEKFGFLVQFSPREHIYHSQLQYLKTLKGLHFDKIRVLKVRKGTKVGYSISTHVVAFMIKENPNWLDNQYTCPDNEFVKALREGSAIDISLTSEAQSYDWSWLDYVANIDDILEDNKCQ